jgi:hypothetical protein
VQSYTVRGLHKGSIGSLRSGGVLNRLSVGVSGRCGDV